MHDPISGVFFFDPADKIYKDHFPGNPIVPGSLIVQAFIDAGKRHGITPESIRLENFRFKRFIAPGEYSYQISPGQDSMICKLYDASHTIVTGLILL